MTDEAAIDAAVAEGRLEDAAELLVAAGRPLEAARRLAEAWRFEPACELALEQAEPLAAFDIALSSDDPALIRRASDACVAAGVAAEAARAAEAKGRADQAGRLFAAAGDPASAAPCFERAGMLLEAARALESLDRLRDAGRLYERCLRDDPADARAALSLARILARFGRYEPAVRALQGALSMASVASEQALDCRRMLVAALDAMGAPEAAAQALAELRRADPGAPSTVEALLSERFGSPLGLRADATEARDLLAGRYRVVEELGEGGSGRVVLADDVFHARRVAVKVMRLDVGLGGRDALDRFLREARVAASIDSPHVVAVYEVEPTTPLLVMEYMPGGTLEERLLEAEAGGHSLPLGELSRLCVSVLSGLMAVHRRGIVHRDVKPANLFFDAAGGLKLGDFGVARVQDRGATATGAMLGTLGYMAPEQISLAHEPTAATDLYAFGSVLYRMLTGELPFVGDDVAVAKLDRAPDPPSSRVEGLPAGLDRLVQRLLAREPEARPRSAQETLSLLAGIDFPDARLSFAVDRAGPGPAPAAEAPASGGERYELREPTTGRARDRWLQRDVQLLEPSAAAVRRLEAFARADHPHLQAVFELDPEAGRAVIEVPRITPGARGLSEAQRADLRDALARVHAEGLVHGAVDWAHVRVGPGRVVLLLELAETSASPADDFAALAALGG